MIKINAVKHFRDTASRGASPAASNGERIANQVAKALHKIGDDFALLDADAIDGVCDLIRMMAGPWPTDTVKRGVFSTVKQAAGKR